jgi:NAD(P)-dependent dehydrogenase (short-subunit alcohol dehydrogenase family)
MGTANQEFAGANVLLTGATSGIGLTTAKQLLESAATVVCVGRNHATLEPLIEMFADRCIPMAADLAEPGAGSRVVAETLERLEHVDVLINAAGVGYRADVSSTSDEQWLRTFTVNVTAPFELCRALLPHFVDNRAGVIVNVASVGGLIGIPNRAAYCASKAALISLTRSLAVEYAEAGVRANCVAPGTTDTPWVDRILAGAEDVEVLRRQMEDRQVIRRLAQPEEIAAAIVFLASPRASFFHGSVVVVDGGYSAR